MKTDPNFILIIAGLGAILLELILGAVTGFDLLILGVAAIIGGFIGTQVNSFPMALTIAVILSLLYLLMGRKMLKKQLAIKTTKTNVDNLIEKKGVVIKSITPSKPGQVKVEGEIWRANAEQTIPEGSSVIIKSVEGVTLKVQ